MAAVVMCAYCHSSLSPLARFDLWVSSEGRISCSDAPDLLGTHWPITQDIDERCAHLLLDLLANL